MKRIIWKITYRFDSKSYGEGKPLLTYVNDSSKDAAIEKVKQKALNCSVVILDCKQTIRYK